MLCRNCFASSRWPSRLRSRKASKSRWGGCPSMRLSYKSSDLNDLRHHVPSSFILPSWIEAHRPSAASVLASTSFFWTSWKLARGLLNWILSKAYSLARFTQSSKAPITPKEIPSRALLRHENGPFNPATPGSICPEWTCTESMKIDPVTLARKASLWLILGAERPFIPYIIVKIMAQVINKIVCVRSKKGFRS